MLAYCLRTVKGTLNRLFRCDSEPGRALPRGCRRFGNSEAAATALNKKVVVVRAFNFSALSLEGQMSCKYHLRSIEPRPLA
jgi:hypothetical protein